MAAVRRSTIGELFCGSAPAETAVGPPGLRGRLWRPAASFG
jgi:hypothetical protein